MEKPLNFVWFCTDQQRYDTIAGLGNTHIRTPNIDRLMNEGVTFLNAYAQSPVCTPSRASFLTGRYPRTTRLSFNGNEEFSKDEKLVTALMRDGGYTCGLVGKLHLTSAFHRREKRFDDGYSFVRWSHSPFNDYDKGANDYQSWLEAKGCSWAEIYDGPRAENPPRKTESHLGNETGPVPELHQTTWCVGQAIEFIESRAGEPWLVSINTFDPHPPLDPPKAYKDRLSAEDMPLPKWREGELDNKPPFQLEDHDTGVLNGANDGVSVNDIPDALMKTLKRDYYAEIMLIDEQLGRLTEYLDAHGLRENTVIIFMSDHGEMLGDHGLLWKGAYFYEQLVHVPLIISCPSRVDCGRRVQGLVELVDVAPTILELAGLDVPSFMQGKSLMGLLTGTETGVHKKSVYSEWYSALLLRHEDVYATMYFDGRYKLVCYHGEDYGELYDLETDPDEFSNLWADAAFQALKYRLIKQSFDEAVLKNRDTVLKKTYAW